MEHMFDHIKLDLVRRKAFLQQVKDQAVHISLISLGSLVRVPHMSMEIMLLFLKTTSVKSKRISQWWNADINPQKALTQKLLAAELSFSHGLHTHTCTKGDSSYSRTLQLLYPVNVGLLIQ